MCVSPLASRRSCSLVSSIPTGLIRASLFPLVHSSLNPEGEAFDGDMPFRTESSEVSHALPYSCESLSLFPTIAGGSFSDDS